LVKAGRSYGGTGCTAVSTYSIRNQTIFILLLHITYLLHGSGAKPTTPGHSEQIDSIVSAKCIHRSKLAHLLGNDAEPAVSHAVIDEGPGRVPRRIPSTYDHVPAARQPTNALAFHIPPAPESPPQSCKLLHGTRTARGSNQERKATHSQFSLSNPPPAAATENLRRGESRTIPGPPRCRNAHVAGGEE
jgi:hypothetical protein